MYMCFHFCFAFEGTNEVDIDVFNLLCIGTSEVVTVFPPLPSPPSLPPSLPGQNHCGRPPATSLPSNGVQGTGGGPGAGGAAQLPGGAPRLHPQRALGSDPTETL